MVTEEVPLDQEVLGPIGDVLLGRKQQGTVVILEDSAADSRLEVRGQRQFLDNFTEQ